MWHPSKIHKETNPQGALVLGVSVIRKRVMAVSVLTCAAAINTDIKIDAGRLPAVNWNGLSHFCFCLFISPFFPFLLYLLLCLLLFSSPRPSQYQPSPRATFRPSRSTQQQSVLRGQPLTLSSSTASTRATRSVATITTSHHTHWQNCQSWTCSVTYPV